jgi:hypothetical protein
VRRAKKSPAWLFTSLRLPVPRRLRLMVFVARFTVFRSA